MHFQESAVDKVPGRPAITDLVDYQGFCGFSTNTPTSPPAVTAEAMGTPISPGGLDAVDGSQDRSEGSEEQESEDSETHSEEGFERISPQDVVERMQAGWAPFVLDVRWAMFVWMVR